MGSGHLLAKPGPPALRSRSLLLTGGGLRAGAPSVLFPAPRGVLLSGCLRSDYLPFGPRGSTVSGRHVYGRAIGAGDFSIRRFYKGLCRGTLRFVGPTGEIPSVRSNWLLSAR